VKGPVSDSPQNISHCLLALSCASLGVGKVRRQIIGGTDPRIFSVHLLYFVGAILILDTENTDAVPNLEVDLTLSTRELTFAELAGL
jgi:hypothetical protein